MPITLYDKDGQPVQVNENDVPSALTQGQLLLRGDQKVNFVDTTGKTWSYGANEVHKAISDGLRVETSEEARQRELKKQYGGIGGQIAALGLGAARGLSFGGSDVLLSAAGAGDVVRDIKEAQPEFSAGGEIGSIALGNVGAFGRAGSLVKGVSKMGKAVERGAGRVLGGLENAGLAGKILSKAGSVGAGSAFEGAVYGGGQFLSEAALGEIDPTVENLFGAITSNALLGGATGGALGAGGELLKGGGRAVRRVTKPMAEGLKDMFERATGSKAMPGLTDALTGMEPGTTAKLLSKEGRTTIMEGDRVAVDGARKLAKIEQELNDLSSEGHDLVTGSSKKSKAIQLAPGENVPGAIQSTKEYFIDAIDRLDAINKEGSGAYAGLGGKLGVRDLKSKLLKYVDDINDLEGSLGKRDLREIQGEVFDIADRGKRSMQHSRNHLKDFSDDRAIATASVIDEIEEPLRKHLELDTVWGEPLAKMQKQGNAKWVEYLKEAKRRPDHKFFESFETSDYEVKRQASPKAHESYVKDFGSTANDLDEAWIKRQHNTQADLLDEMSKHYEEPKLDAISERYRAKVSEYEKLHNDLKGKIGVQNQYARMKSELSNMGISLGAGGVGGFLVGGPIGAIAGTALSIITDPMKKIKVLTMVDRLSKGFEVNLGSAIKSYTGKVTSFGKRMVAPTVVNWPEEPKKQPTNEERFQAYDRRMKQVSALATNPAYAVDHLAKTTGNIQDVAPRVASGLQSKTIQIANYLNSKAPKNPLPPAVLKNPNAPKWRPSSIEMAKFEAIAKVLDNPANVIKSLANRTLTHEAVDALRENFPILHTKIVNELVSELSDKAVAYEDQVQLSILFGVPLDQTMNPAFVMDMQKASGILKAQFQQTGQQIAKGARVNAQSYQTESQRIASRKA